MRRRPAGSPWASIEAEAGAEHSAPASCVSAIDPLDPSGSRIDCLGGALAPGSAPMAIRLRIEAWGAETGPTSITLELDQPRVVLGRGASSDVLLPHPSVSTLHATLRQTSSGFAIVDERSTNGVEVQGSRIAPERQKPLRTGDVLRIGPYRIHVTLGVAVPRVTTSDEATSLARRLVLEPTAERSLLFLNGPRCDERVALPEGPAEWRIGRADDAELRLDDAECSRHHATLLVSPDAVIVRDEGSKNGVTVQGRPAGNRRLRDRDELLVGATSVLFEDPREAAVIATSRLEADEPPPAEPAGPEEITEANAADETSETIGPDALPGEHEMLDLVDHAAEPPSREAPRSAARRAPVPADRMADQFVYALSILVLALSVGAIFWLFGQG